MSVIPEKALANHTAVLGKTGSGKTSTEKVYVEQVVAAGFRVCVLDTTKSDWWGVTSSASGKKPGLPFKILGGPRGHVPLHSSAGKVIGQLVGSGKLPLSIVDMADFEPGGVQRFFVDFAPALMRSARGVVYLVIEEAHEIAPKERAGFGAENMAIHWAKKLATAGRSKGIRLIVATQRVQSLHNAVLGSCETVIAHRLTTPADQEPVLKWLKANSDKATVQAVESSLSSLATGTAWMCSGEARIFEQVKFPKFTTYDNTATPTGDGADHEVKTAPVNHDELAALIGDAVKEAEANDPKRLKGELERLKRELAKKAPQPDPTAIAAAEARVREQALEEGIAIGEAKAREGVIAQAVAAIQRLAGRGGHITPAPKVTAPAPPTSHQRVATRVDDTTIATRKRTAPPIGHGGGVGGDLPAGERTCLIAIAQHGAGVARKQLSVLTGYKRATRDAYILRLRNRGFVEQSGDRVVATDAGITALGDSYDPLPTGAALRERVLRDLPEGERKVLEILIDQHPNTVSRDSIDEATGFKRATRDAYLLRLRSRELVEAVGRGEARASDNLFD